MGGQGPAPCLSNNPNVNFIGVGRDLTCSSSGSVLNAYLHSGRPLSVAELLIYSLKKVCCEH